MVILHDVMCDKLALEGDGRLEHKWQSPLTGWMSITVYPHDSRKLRIIQYHSTN